MKRLKLLLTAVLLAAAATAVPLPAGATLPACWYVCSYGPTEYCYYDDGCVPSCCRYDDWECLNPCAP